MPNDRDTEVIIVGGGPAGATAAYLLRKQGIQVLVIEKDRLPRKKPCGGMLTRKTTKLVERVFGETVEQLDAQGLVEYSTHDFEIRTSQKTLMTGQTTYPSVLVDRKDYDLHLIQKARALGAKVMDGQRVVKVDAVHCQVTTAAGEVFRGRFLLGADGVYSLVRRSIPKLHKRVKAWRKNLATTLEVFPSIDEISPKITRPILFFGLVDRGYGWIFPNRDRLVLGVGGLEERNNDFPEALNKLLTLAGYKGEKSPKPAGYHVPYGNHLRSPGSGRTLLLGDAAGLVDPFLGEGIYYAQRSGELAAESIREAILVGEDASASKIYTHKIRMDIHRELRTIKTYRWLLFHFLEITRYEGLKYVLRIIGMERASQLIHGLISYRTFAP